MDAGFPTRTANAIVDKAGSAAASGSTHAVAPPPGTSPQVVHTVQEAVRVSFTHSIHIAFLVAVGFAVLASVVSAIFVRSHVGAGEDAAGGH